MKFVPLAISSGVAFSVLYPAIAASQEENLFARDRNIAVSERARPELEALGVRAGTFLLYPKVQFDAGTDSNVAAAGIDHRSDVLFRVGPRVDIESDWTRHSVTGNVRGAFTRFQEYENENTDTWAVTGAGRIDVRRFTRITVGAEYADEVEPRTSSNSPGSIAKPIQYNVLSANAGFSHTINRLRASGRVDVREYDYEDGVSIGGATVEQDDRDQTTYEATGRLDYALSPATALYGRVTINDRRYRFASSPTTPIRDSQGYNAVAGVNFELSNLVRGEVGVGYLSQEFDNPLYGEFSGVSANARIEYFVSPLLTLGFTVDRSVGDSGIAETAGFLSTNVQLTADYELRRNILLGARVGRSVDEFNSIDRKNTRSYATARATYLVNRRIGVTASYDYESRDSTGRFATNDFTANRFLVSLVAQF